jgi:uncharacterized protein (TIGR03000 family)
MMRSSWKYLLLGAVVMVALSSAVPQADAQWWGCCRPAAWGCCYTPCYTTCYTPCYTACDPCGGWYLGWRPGPVRRLVFGRYKWYWGGCGWSCCSAYSCCEGTPAPCCGATATPAPAQGAQPTPAKKPVVEPQAAPTEPAPPVPAAPSVPATPGALPPPTTDITPDNSGVLTVWVPYDAKVTINGLATKSVGSRRQYISHGLKPGLSYTYVVKAELRVGDQVLEDTKTVTLTAGKQTAVAFGFNATGEQVAAAN